MITEEIKKRFIQIVGSENYDDSKVGRLTYSYDATPNLQAMPDAVMSPRSTEEIQQIVKICNEHKIPIVPRGTGTNLCGGTCPVEGGIVLLFKHMNRILEIDEDNLTATVEPGVITLDLYNAALEKGFLYPPDPGSMKSSTIGGNIMENSGGLRALKYGVTSDYVMGLEIVLPNGELMRTGGKLTKDVAGYDFTRLYVGSEGTLGIITKALLKLVPIPESKKTILALYEDLEAAGRSVSKIIASKIIPATLEFLDQPTIQAVEDYVQIGLPTEAKAVLLIEQDGPPEIVERDVEKIIELCKSENAVSVQVAQTAEEAEALTTARRWALSAIARIAPTTILEDATVPRSEIARMVHYINEIAAKYNLPICTFGHAGDGNLHPTVPTDARNKEEMERVEHAFEEIFIKAVELGGTITGEHGVGVAKAPYLELKLGEAGVAAMKAVKDALDPNNIMNPSKIFAKSSKKRVVVGK